MELQKQETQIQEITIKENGKDVKLYYCHTNKFKTFYTRCVYFFDFDYKLKPVYLVLSYLLDRTTSIHPNEEEFIGYLYNNYDMYHDVGVTTSGLTNKFIFSSGTINTKYVHEDINLLEVATDVLEETILHPNFDVDIFEEIKASLVENVINKQNNKLSVAYNQFLDIMFKDETYNKKVIRDPSLYSKITLDEVKEAYNELMKCEHFYTYIGEDSLEDVIKAFSKLNLNQEKTCNRIYLDKESKEITAPSFIIEDYDVNQSHLFIGYRTPIFSDHDDYYAMHIFNIMLGVSGNSELFEIVREKHGLAYSIYSSYVPSKGTVFIDCGISKENYEKTIELINVIVKNYQEGNINIDKLELVKSEIISSIKSELDSINSTSNKLISIDLIGGIKTAKEKIDKVNSITIEDIKRAANSIVLDTIYFMRGNK